VTGGYQRHWEDIDLANVGYPIAELTADGSCTITKPAHSGGIVDRHTVAAQLVYEIGDPQHYLTPDVDVDFTAVEIEVTGHNRVKVSGAKGNKATDSYKVSLAYRAGYMASGQLLVYGRDCVPKARACGQMILDRLRRADIVFQSHHIECLGAGEALPGGSLPPDGLREVMLRLTVSDPSRESVERFTREFAPLATSGPAGLAGYTAARGAVRPVFAYWPTLVPKQHVPYSVEVRSARDWV
jgi:hypothetical protein